MDFNAMLSQLKDELQLLNEAIVALERLAGATGKRRGRPPKWMSENRDEASADEDSGTESPSRRGRRTFSPEARKRMAEAQKKRWAERKEAKDAKESKAEA